MGAQQWHPIEPIPPTTQHQRSPRLSALAKQWQVEREGLKARGLEHRFLEEMKNRMAVETGIIEGLYDLERGVTETLIAEGFDAALLPHGGTDRDPQLVVAILRDQREAIDYVFELVKGERELSTSVIKELHQVLTRHQPTTTAMDQFGTARQVELRRGEWKAVPNNPTRPDGTVHAYCPPEQVPSEMDRLIDYLRQYQAIGVAPEILAAWLHHRFSQIHPFQDGNGRVARLLSSIVFIKERWFPLVVLRDDRAAYIDALEKADAGDLQPLIKLFADWQTRAFILALGASHKTEAEVSPHLDDVLASLRDKLTHKPAVPTDAGLDQVADVVQEMAERVFDRTAEAVRKTLSADLPQLNVTVAASKLDQSDWYKGPRIDLAKASDFFADFTRGSRWVRIIVRPASGAEQATILMSSAALVRSQGSLAITCGLIVPDVATNRADTMAVSDEPFIATVADIAEQEAREDLETRFTEWLSNCLLLALAQWQRR